MRILFIGDIVGNPGRRILGEKLPAVLRDYPADLIVANGENAAAGLGINATIIRELLELGIDIITMGNHTWSKREIFHVIDDEPRLVRPMNVSSLWPGNDYWVSQTTPPILVSNLVGQVYMESADNPFHALESKLDRWKIETGARIVLIDFHAEATAEKAAFARYFDGRVTAVLGTHTHVQTADETVFERGTAFISDVGMTGPVDSVIGMETSSSLRRFVERLPSPFSTATGRAMINAVWLEADPATGRATTIKRIRLVEDV